MTDKHNLKMHSADIAISVRNLSKTYRLFGHPATASSNFLALASGSTTANLLRSRTSLSTSKRAKRSGSLAGTARERVRLLQLICGIIKPTAGTVQANGSISALLEFGAGFNRNSPGSENVYFHGALMGFTEAQMNERFDEIAAFADIGDFIDQPVRTYSSGMFVRLAFAVAISVDPSILVVDEALAVGDALFQKRCYARLDEMKSRGVTLILVSHDTELIRNLTSQALLLEQGKSLYWGDTRIAADRYRKALHEREAIRFSSPGPDAALQEPRKDRRNEGESENGGAKITGLRILSADGKPCSSFRPNAQIHLEFTVQIESHLNQLNVAVIIRTLQGLKVYSWGTLNQDIDIWAGKAQGDIFWDKSFQPGDRPIVKITLEGNLGAGTYIVEAAVSREMDKYYGAQLILSWRDDLGALTVETSRHEYFFGGICNMHGKAILSWLIMAISTMCIGSGLTDQESPRLPTQHPSPDKYLASCGPGRILDVGSGMGALVRELLKQGADAHGVDVSPIAVEQCNHLTPERFHVGSVLALPFPDESFESLISTDCLEHLAPEDIPKALHEMRRVSRRNLFLCVATEPDRDGHWHLTIEKRTWSGKQGICGRFPKTSTVLRYHALSRVGN